jgi:hypothetical protein
VDSPRRMVRRLACDRRLQPMGRRTRAARPRLTSPGSHRNGRPGNSGNVSPEAVNSASFDRWSPSSPEISSCSPSSSDSDRALAAGTASACRATAGRRPYARRRALPSCPSGRRGRTRAAGTVAQPARCASATCGPATGPAQRRPIKPQGQYTALRITQRLLDAGWLRRPCGFQNVFPAPRAALQHAPLRPSGRDDETGWPHLRVLSHNVRRRSGTHRSPVGRCVARRRLRQPFTGRRRSSNPARTRSRIATTSRTTPIVNQRAEPLITEPCHTFSP